MSEKTCPRCNVPMTPGVFTRQTFNRLRPGQTTLYPCGSGKLDTCLKCPRCGHSIEATIEKRTNS